MSDHHQDVEAFHLAIAQEIKRKKPVKVILYQTDFPPKTFNLTKAGRRYLWFAQQLNNFPEWTRLEGYDADNNCIYSKVQESDPLDNDFELDRREAQISNLLYRHTDMVLTRMNDRDAVMNDRIDRLMHAYEKLYNISLDRVIQTEKILADSLEAQRQAALFMHGDEEKQQGIMGSLVALGDLLTKLNDNSLVQTAVAQMSGGEGAPTDKGNGDPAAG